MEELKKKTGQMLRAVLISSPRGVPLYRLDKEYRGITFEPIPYRKCGFSSLEDFLRAIPDVARIQTDRDGETVVRGVASEADQHVAKLIAKQKKPKLRKSSAKRPFRRPQSNIARSSVPMFPTRRFGPRPTIVPPSVQSVIKPPTNTARKVTVVSNSGTSGATSTKLPGTPRFVPPRMLRLAMGSQERTRSTRSTTPSMSSLQVSAGGTQRKVTVVGVGTTAPTTTQRRVTPPQEEKTSKSGKFKTRDGPNLQDMEVITSSFSNLSVSNHTSPAVKTTSNNTEIDSVVLERIQKIVSSKPNGVFSTRLPKEYKSQYNEELPDTVVEQLKSMPDVVHSEEPVKGNVIFYPCKKQEKPPSPPPPPLPAEKKEAPVETVELFYLRSRVPAVDSTVEVYVSHVNSLHDFYVQYKSCEDKLAQLQNLLLTDCEGATDIPKPVKDMFCAAKFTEDESWYRGLITECIDDRNTQTVKVLYVDYGNSEYLPCTRLRHLKESHAVEPVMAMHCSLDGINEIPKDTDVLEKCLQRFKDLTTDAVKMTVLERNGEVLRVNLVTLESVEINSTLVKEVRGLKDDSRTFNDSAIPQAAVKTTALTTDDTSYRPSVPEARDMYRPSVPEERDIRLSTPDVRENYRPSVPEVRDNYKPSVPEARDNRPNVPGAVDSRPALSDATANRSVVLEAMDNSFTMPSTRSSSTRSSSTSSLSSATDEPATASATNERKKSAPKPFLRSRSIQKDKEVVKIPEKVVVPDEEYIDVVISTILNTENISVMLYGEDYSDKLLAMEFSMKTYFDDTSEAYHAKVGDLCAICTKQLHPEAQWYRVRVLSIAGDQAQLEFVDYGDIKHARVEDLKALPPRFLELPFQAFTISLYGIPRSKNPEVLDKLKHVILGKQLVAEIIDRTGDAISVELYDTSSDADINMNDIVRSLIIPDEDLKPALPKVGQQTTVIVVYASETSLFVQIPGAGLTRLEELMTDITEHYSQATKAAEFVPKPHVGKICCGKAIDGAWYRAIVTQLFPTDRKVEVQYVDYGHKEVISMHSLREPTKANEHVSSLPFQAVEVKLSGVGKEHLSADQRDKLMQLASDNECIILEVVKRDTPAMANLFLTTEDDSMVNILDYVLDEANEEQASVKEEEPPANNSTQESAAEKDSSSQDELEEASGNLPPPITLSRPWVDITVSDITDPGNFMFQPLGYLQKLEDLMSEMAQHYDTAKKEPLISPRLGDMCAAKQDGHYYRALVKAVLAPQQICVRFVDYGDFGILHSSVLQVLRDEFKELPCLAVHGALADLQGCEDSGFWSDAANTRFEGLTHWKQLVASVEGDQYSYSFREEHKVPLNVYDTSSGNNDVNIGDTLVDEGLAKRTKS